MYDEPKKRAYAHWRKMMYRWYNLVLDILIYIHIKNVAKGVITVSGFSLGISASICTGRKYLHLIFGLVALSCNQFCYITGAVESY